ncbi:phosphoribosylglycinamide formyltransferase [Kaarinaea lacus]
MNPRPSAQTRLPVVVLVSGNGSNLQAIIDAAQQDLPIEIRVVISDREKAYGLTRAEQAGIKTKVIKADKNMSREDYDRRLQECIDAYQPGLIVLAGFMRILSDNFVKRYSGMMINIHPSLLPKFRGLNTHQRAIDAKEVQHGATVHFVTPELDGGPAILQAQVPVQQGDTAEKLANRVLQREHQIYPLAIRWYAESRLEFRDNQVYLDNQLLTEPVQFPVEPNSNPLA